MSRRTPLVALAIAVLALMNLAVVATRLPPPQITAQVVGPSRAVAGEVTIEEDLTGGTGEPGSDTSEAVRSSGPRISGRSLDLIGSARLQRHGPKPFAPPPAPGEGLAAFEGLSTWVDTYDTGLTAVQQVQIAAAEGVQTIFFQVSRGSTDASIHDYDRLSRVIEVSHDLGMRVMVWTIPDFERHSLDFARAREAMAFITPRGDRPDAFGLDIESDALPDVALRTERLLHLAAELRAWAGPDYPIAAIVLPPLQLELNTTWWPGFPYAGLAAHTDVFIPMSYSSYRGTDAPTTFHWNVENIRRVRHLAGVPDLPIHLAGGIADNLPEVGEFVRAASVGGAIGAGLYDLHTTRPEAWGTLRQLRVDEVD